jgi:glycosyltransferase involved in cell wall biosynthesis
MAVVEAMASGSVPVIVSKGGLNEIISDKVDGFLWHDTKELVSKTQHLIGSPILLAKMSKSAIIKSAKFSKENFQNKLLSICSK